MRVSFTLLVALAPAVAAWHTQRIVPAPRSPRLAAAPRCDAASQGSESEAPVASTHRSAVDLVAQSGDRRVAVSGLSPQGQGQQQQQFVGVPPPSAQPPTLLQKARTPFMGLTLLATAAVAAWQSNRLYARRQIALLDEFAATMVFHLGDEREMASCLRSFRQQLGPGSFTGDMFVAFLKAMATSTSIGVPAVVNLKSAAAIFGLSDAAAAKLLEQTASELERQPSVLGKLTFLSERAMPMAASMAKLRTKFPNWSFDTVTALQRAMLEDLYRKLCEDLPPGATPDSTTLDVLGLSEADARRLMAEVHERKEAEEAAAAAKAEEELRALKLQQALERAAETKAMTTRTTRPPSAPPATPVSPPADSPGAPASSPVAGATLIKDDDTSSGGLFGVGDADDAGAPDEEVVDRASGTHEFECTKCGYVLFPAAGREFKFFGEGFTCPGCGATKDDFVDNGPVDM